TLSNEQPTRIGYKFKYWRSLLRTGNYGLTYLPGETYTHDEDLTLYADWQEVGTNYYYIETYVMNTSGDYELFSEEGIECTNNEIVTADYTVNEGFTLNEELSILSGTVRASSSLVLKVYIDRNKHNLTFNDGATTLTDEYYYEQNIGNIYYPQKEGYTFLGWSEDGETVADVVTTMPDRDVEYTALWSANEYSITFLYGDVNDNAVYQTVTQDYGSDVSAPEDPGFEGYTFTGWSSDIPETMPANNLAITAQWAINSYTVTYKLDGVEYFATPYETAVDTVVYGGTVLVREKAVRDGYTVSDWEFTPALVAGKMPASDVVANAISTANSYSLTIDYIIADGHDELTPSSYSEDVPFGQPYSIDSPAIMGYTPDIVTVEGTMGNEPIAVTVTYEPNDYALVISYVMSDGNNMVKPADVEQRVTYNTGYNVTSPVIMGYSPDITSVTGTMDSVDGKTVTVTYAPNPHTVTWFIDGEIYQCDSVVFGDTIVAPIPEKEGYTLSDWTPTVAATVADEDYEYNATWIANEYELSIIYVMSDGSDAPAAYSGQVTYNTAYNVESPSVTGYTPDIAVVEGTMDDVNGKTVTVTYEPNAHTVTWNVDGEKTVDDVVYGEEIVKPADPEKEGYTFEGWSEDGETVVEVEETVPDRDIEYIALWTINSYTVTYKLDGAEYFATPYESAVDTVVYGETVTVREKAVQEGYTVSDWVFTPALVDGRMPAGNVVANATSTVNSYKITYNVDGVKYDETTYEYNADVIKLDEPAKQGFVFSGWDREEPAKMPAENLILNGSFSAETDTGYTVETYVMNLSGEYDKTSESLTGTTGETVAAEYTVTEGFSLNTDKSELEGVIAADGSLVLKVYLDRNKHNISFNDGTNTTSDELYYGDEITKPEDPEKEGYTFEGWSEDGETVVDVAETVPDRDIEYTAVWKVNQYTITLYYGEVNDNAVYKTITEDFGTAIEEIADPEFEGYSFTGWNMQIPATMPSENINISALWNINSYTITYKLDGVEYFATPYKSAVDTVVYGESVTVREKAVKEGYTVSDWKFTPALVDGRMPAGNVVANATSTVNTYTLTFTYGEVNSGAVYKEITADYGSEINTPANPEFSGFIFREWDSDIPSTMPAENRTINALWDNGDFTVTYKLDGEDYPDTESASDTFLYGEPVTVRDKAVKEGYIVSDWEFTPALEDGKMPASNVAANATSMVNSYTVTWIVNGKSTVDSYDFGAEIIRPEDPSIAGKVFKGWSGEIPSTMPARNLVFAASFDAIMHTATFVVPDKEGSYTDETGTYEVVKAVIFEEGQTTIAEPAVPQKDGYVGVWEDYTIGKEDIVIKAIYTITDTDNTGKIETDKTADKNSDGSVTIT
ncbi:MAG: InlB B-repeat-containing protein, partial [Clostridia bacterium]|nr:InlB B-repeat-containing protein [Clostridia bacterium]